MHSSAAATHDESVGQRHRAIRVGDFKVPSLRGDVRPTAYELYAIPALVAAAITVATVRLGVYGLPAALGAAAVCFTIRMLGVHFGLNTPTPPGGDEPGSPVSELPTPPPDGP
jgi:hypothetical protein